jgi:hypothetical protein
MTPSPPRDLPNVSLDQVSLTPSQTDGPEPTLERTCMPILGWYFAFVINPKASLGFLGNDQVAKFISRRQTYIAYLDSVSLILDRRSCTAECIKRWKGSPFQICRRSGSLSISFLKALLWKLRDALWFRIWLWPLPQTTEWYKTGLRYQLSLPYHGTMSIMRLSKMGP